MPSFDIGIIGLGPAGLSVLQRLLSRSQHLPYKKKSNKKLRVAIFEPNPPGTGVHNPTQSHCLSLHTIAAQANMFPASEYFKLHGIKSESESEIASIEGFSFFEWCHAQQIKLDEFNQVISLNGMLDDCDKVDVRGRDVEPTDCLPRYLVGEYLSYCYQHLLAACPSHVELILFPFLVTDLETINDAGKSIFIVVHEKQNIKLCSMVLTLGYTGKKWLLDEGMDTKEIHIYYPLPCLKQIKAKHTVAVQGVGLCALDVLSMLTLGRGGKMKTVPNKSVAEYLPSGAEPRILLLSCSGLVYRARPDSKVIKAEYQTLLFTDDRINAFALRPKNSIDFKRDILPIIYLEMRAVYVLTSLKGDKDTFHSILFKMAHIDDDLVKFTDYLCQLESDHGKFEAERYMHTQLPDDIKENQYDFWCQSFLLEDLLMAKQGLLHPVKAALEVWHSIIPQIRRLINFDRLSDLSRIEVYTHLYGPVKRSVGGAEVARNELLLALMEAGIVEIKPFKTLAWQDDDALWTVVTQDGHQYGADYLIHAYLAKSGPQNTDSKLMQCLVNVGLVSLSDLNANKLDYMPVNQHFQLLSLTGKAAPNLWLLGPSLEGLAYLNHHLPSSHPSSMDFINADSIAKQALTLAGKM